MNQEIDFSQYLRKNPSQVQSNNQEVDFSQFMRKPEKPERSTLEQGARLAGQFGLGLAESALLPYEIGVSPHNMKGLQTNDNLSRIGQDIEYLYEKNSDLTGMAKPVEQWSSEDQALYADLSNRIKNPSKVAEEDNPIDLSIRGLTEKATGLDLHPEGITEKIFNWAAFIKDPRKIKDLFKSGVSPKQALKAISPTGTEALRAVGAGTALEMAEQGNFGPIGTMAAVIVGDIAGGGIAKTGKGIAKLVTKPKETIANVVASFTPKDKLKLQKEIIKDFKDAGIQPDLGTITDSNLIKWTQSRLAQSGLTGKALDDFKHELTGQIKSEYEKLADSLGKSKYANTHEAGEIAKEGMKKIREADLAESRNLYKTANASLKEKAFVDSRRLASAIKKIEENLKPGQLKSTEQQTVLRTLDTLKRDVFDSQGNVIYAKVKDLINNKIALNDIINYEVQGGTKQLLKGIVGDLDRAIISHGKENPTFAKNYINANKRFSEHAKTFRNRYVEDLLKDKDPAQLINKMDTVFGIRKMGRVLDKSIGGKEIFNNLKRLKLDEIVGKNLVDSSTKQVKLGTFSKLLEKSKNKQVVKELLGAEAFKRLEKLQKNAGRLAEAADKFYNASKSGAVAADAAVLAKGMSDIAHLLMGNPWPIIKTGTGLVGARQLSNLLADPTFLKLTEEAILASEKGTQKELINAFERLRPYILQANQQLNHQPNEP